MLMYERTSIDRKKISPISCHISKRDLKYLLRKQDMKKMLFMKVKTCKKLNTQSKGLNTFRRHGN